MIDAPKQEQKVTIEINSAQPVDVVVRLASNPSKPLVTKKSIKDESFEVTIPANEGFEIVLESTKDTKVSVKAKST